MASSSSKSSNLTVRSLHDLTKERYLNYAMSVIMSRALPDVRDGLKPVQRRVLYSMFNDLKLYPDKKHRKSATVVGTALGKYHPHGDVALYEAMVRMAQDWVLRLPLVDGYGNFGNIDGDGSAAHRYTEARLRQAGMDLMSEIRQDVVNFLPNFDGTATEPEVLPAGLPLLLINGAQGIAVGMATNIPPHNPSEVINAAIDLLKNPSRKVGTLVKNHIKGPDFPTGGSIVEEEEDLISMYEEGRGSVTIRAKWEVEKKGKTEYLVITEIPYGVQKQDLVAKIASHIVDNSLPQVVDIRDESTEDIRVVLELKKNVDVDNVMAYLFRHTPLESKFHTNMTCLAPSDADPTKLEPKRVDLKEMLQHFLDFRMSVVLKRLRFDLDKLEARLHILEGYVKVLKEGQKAIDLVTKAQSKDEARDSLMQEFGITEDQADSILNTKVYRFAGYEIDALVQEQTEKETKANELRMLLSDPDAQVELVVSELREMRKVYSDERRTLVEVPLPEFAYDASAFIEEVDCKVIVSRNGWVRRQKAYTDLDTLRCRDDDQIGWALSGNTKDTVSFCTNKGRVYTSRVVDLPDTSGYGDPIQSLFDFEDGEKILSVFMHTPEFLPEETRIAVIADNGKGFLIDHAGYSEPSTVTGRKIMRLEDNENVVAYDLVHDLEEDHIVVITRGARAIAFRAKYLSEVRSAAKGVKCITLMSGDSVLVGGVTTGAQGSLTVVTSNGAEKALRHTTVGVTTRGGVGKELLSRDSFVSYLKETVER